MTYRAPLAEMEFCAAQIVGQDRLAETALFAEAAPETRCYLCEGHWSRSTAMATCTRPGWRTGEPMRPSPRAWVGITGNPEYGGMGLPQCFATFVNEMMASSCLSLRKTTAMTYRAPLAEMGLAAAVRRPGAGGGAAGLAGCAIR